jgi:hypothetical protein
MNYWGTWHGGSGRKKRYYCDAGYRAQGAGVCKATHIQADALDAWVLGQLRDALIGDTGAVASIVEQFVSAVCVPSTASRAPANRSKEMAAINARIKKTVALMTDSDLEDIGELKTALVGLQRHRAALAAEVAAPRPVAAPCGPDPERAREWAYKKLDALAAVLKPGGADLDLRAAVHEFVDRIEVDPNARVGTLYLPKDAFAALQTSFSRRERHASSTHSWMVLAEARLGSPR